MLTTRIKTRQETATNTAKKERKTEVEAKAETETEVEAKAETETEVEAETETETETRKQIVVIGRGQVTSPGGRVVCGRLVYFVQTMCSMSDDIMLEFQFKDKKDWLAFYWMAVVNEEDLPLNSKPPVVRTGVPLWIHTNFGPLIAPYGLRFKSDTRQNNSPSAYVKEDVTRKALKKRLIERVSTTSTSSNKQIKQIKQIRLADHPRGYPCNVDGSCTSGESSSKQ